jgi:hypothetical protein
MLVQMSSRDRWGGLIANAVGVMLVVATAAGFWLYPMAMPEFLAKAASYVGIVFLGGAVRESKPLQIFLIACVAVLTGILVLAALYRAAPEYFAPAYAVGGALTVMLFLRSDRLKGEQKKAVAFVLVRVVCALLLVASLTPMMLRAGHVGIALAIWIVFGVLAIWRLLNRKNPLSTIGWMSGDPWRSDRDKDGTWRA